MPKKRPKRLANNWHPNFTWIPDHLTNSWMYTSTAQFAKCAEGVNHLNKIWVIFTAAPGEL